MIRTQRTSPISRAHTPPSPRALGALFVALVGLAVAGACRNTATDPGNSLGIAGTFQLRSVNGAPLPYQDPGSNTFVVRGSLVIHGSPRYDLIEIDSAAGATSTVTSSGQWNISSNALVLKADDGNDYFGVMSGTRDTVRVQLGAHLGTYVRQ